MTLHDDIRLRERIDEMHARQVLYPRTGLVQAAPVVSQRHAQHGAAFMAAVAPHAPLGPRVALADDDGPTSPTGATPDLSRPPCPNTSAAPSSAAGVDGAGEGER